MALFNFAIYFPQASLLDTTLKGKTILYYVTFPMKQSTILCMIGSMRGVQSIYWTWAWGQKGPPEANWREPEITWDLRNCLHLLFNIFILCKPSWFYISECVEITEKGTSPKKTSYTLFKFYCVRHEWYSATQWYQGGLRQRESRAKDSFQSRNQMYSISFFLPETSILPFIVQKSKNKKQNPTHTGSHLLKYKKRQQKTLKSCFSSSFFSQDSCCFCLLLLSVLHFAVSSRFVPLPLGLGDFLPFHYMKLSSPLASISTLLLLTPFVS